MCKVNVMKKIGVLSKLKSEEICGANQIIYGLFFARKKVQDEDVS